MKKILLWKGYHHANLAHHLRTSWDNGDLAIFLPPLLKDFSFIQSLPEGQIEHCGSWSQEEILQAQNQAPRKECIYPQPPILGLFSSGSAGGQAKLILYSKKNIEFSLNGVMDFFDTESIQHIFCYPHPFHTFGLLLGYALAMLKNCQITALDGKYNSQFHQQWLDTVTEKTLTLGTPTHFKDLMHFVSALNVKPKTSYSCIIGGAPVSPLLWQNIKDQLNIQNPSIGYGATEASPALTHLSPGQKPKSSGDIGMPLKNVEIIQVPRGIEFKGPNVCLAVIQNGTVEFPQKITLNDELQKNTDGSYTFMGRTDFLLNRGGEKFKLEEIENYLFEKHKLNITALCVPEKRLGYDLGLLIETSAGESLTPREDILQTLFSKYKIHFDGSLFLRTPRLPLNDNGKRDRASSTHLWNELYKTAQKIYEAT